MAKGILRGNKVIFNFSLDKTDELVEWLQGVSPTKVAREGLKLYKDKIDGVKQEEKQALEVEELKEQVSRLSEQVSQLTQTMQMSNASNHQLLNSISLAIQSLSMQQPTQQQMVMPSMETLMAFMTQNQPQVNNNDEQAAAEENTEPQYTEEQMQYAEEQNERVKKIDPLAFGS